MYTRIKLTLNNWPERKLVNLKKNVDLPVGLHDGPSF